MTALTPRRPIKSVRITVLELQLEQAIIALLAIGTALAVIGAANIAGYIVGRFG